MGAILGEGDFRYEYVTDWHKQGNRILLRESVYRSRKVAEGREQVDFGAAEGFDIDPVVGAGNGGADGDRDDVSEFGAFRRAPYAGHRRWRK